MTGDSPDGECADQTTRCCPFDDFSSRVIVLRVGRLDENNEYICSKKKNEKKGEFRSKRKQVCRNRKFGEFYERVLVWFDFFCC